MSLDRTKVLEAAQKHLAKGNYDKAILELRKVVESDPSDVRTLLKIGDLYTRKGARAEAIETYGKVAKQYGSHGFFLKAVAVYKQILKLDPARLDVQLQLGEMYEMLQLTSDALSTYEHVAASYARAGEIEPALATLAKMGELDPENIPVRIKYAEALSKAGRMEEAAGAFETSANLLREQGRVDDYLKVAERLLYHRPEDVQLARELAAMYLERNDARHALGKLQACFKADSKDIKTLELLAEAFNQLGQLPKTISVYREVARLHQEAQRPEERALTLRKILQYDPGDAEARQALASFASGSTANVRRDIAPPASAVVKPRRAAPLLEEPELEELDEDELHGDVDDELELLAEAEELIEVDEDIVEPEKGSMNLEPDGDPSSSSRLSMSPDLQREAQIARLLTECDVFLRYGLKQKVVEQLRAVLQLDPRHVEAHERLKEAYLAQGDVEAAVGELLALADILASERSAVAVLYLREALILDPASAAAQARLLELGAGAELSRSPMDLIPSGVWGEASEEPIAARSGDELSSAGDPDDIFFIDEESTEDAVDGAPAAPPVSPISSPQVTPPPALASRDLVDSTASAPALLLPEEVEPQQAMLPGTPPDSFPTLPPPALSMAPEAPTTPAPFEEVAALRVPKPAGLAPAALDLLAPMTPEEFEDVPLRPSDPGMATAQVERRSFAPGEVEELLDEADFFVAQGLFEEARAILGDALRSHPGHVLVEEKRRDVEQFASIAEAERSASSVEVPVDQSFELAEKLAGDIDEDPGAGGSDVLDVERVFAQFKRGVDEQVGPEDSETHFDLGIAYKEMGLLDDAINEFRLCFSNPARICIAETMIGLCHIERGDVSQAIAHFKKGLYADTKTEREELGLYFELGSAYDLLRDPKEALYYFQKVQKRDPDFRGVSARVQALAQTQVPEPSPLEDPDDIDRAFDDLMSGD